MLNYLANTSRPDSMMAVHQCTRFCKNPNLSHKKAMKRIVKYLLGTWHVGMQAGINHDIRLTACADLDFANRWNKLNPEDASCFHSRTGYIIYCVSAPIV